MTRDGVDGEFLREIKRVIMEEAGKLGVRVEKVILFGSRARGEAREDSDWDILVVIVGGLEWRVRKLLWRRIYRRLRPLLGGPVDLLIEGTEYYSRNVEEEASFEAAITGEGIHV
ncbi:MAG: nucleotidyltransferase domain-containing protein [Desulfurococcales archaeon]|nr:nucleotidyltransferase domain-containing protein [Desulfurococcales archaeon]